MNDVQNVIVSLHTAATMGDARAVDQLLQVHRPLVNHPNKFGHTALHLAAYHNQPQVVRILLQHGANAHAKDSYGMTPLQLAQDAGHQRIIQILASNWKR